MRVSQWSSALKRPGVRKVAHNTVWLLADRVVRLGIGFFVGAWVARYLGPERFGTLSYVTAFVTLFGTMIPVGTDNVVVRDLARHPGQADAIMASATAIRLLATPVIIAVVGVAAVAMHGSDRSTLGLIALFAVTLVFRPWDVVELWFQAETNVRPTVWARNLVFFASSAAKVALIVSVAPLLAFVALEPVASALGAAALVWVYRRAGRRFTVAGATRTWFRNLLGAGTPLLLSSMAIIVYMRIDQIMLEHLSGGGMRQVGLYSAAQRLSEVWYFVPMAIASAVFPTLVRSREQDRAQYTERLGRLFSLMTLVALGVAIPTSALAPYVVRLVFGAPYAGAAPVLSIHVWTAVFVFWGVVGEAWYLNEGLTRLTLYRTGSAALANVALNFVLIPRYGGAGAAVATLISQAWSAWLSNLVWRTTRPLFLLQLRSLSLRGLLR